MVISFASSFGFFRHGRGRCKEADVASGAVQLKPRDADAVVHERGRRDAARRHGLD